MAHDIIPERRSPERPPEPSCPVCQSEHVQRTVRTDFVVYYRCEDCAEVWVLEKLSAFRESVLGL
jgi:transposase-like protein